MGETHTHDIVVSHQATLLRQRLHGSPCVVFAKAPRLGIAAIDRVLIARPTGQLRCP